MGDNILPVDLEQSTTQLVCRIKYCDKLTVSMCNTANKTHVHKTFESVQEMKRELEVICKNGDSDIEIVDIGYPVKVLQVNTFWTFYHWNWNYDKLYFYLLIVIPKNTHLIFDWIKLKICFCVLTFINRMFCNHTISDLYRYM